MLSLSWNILSLSIDSDNTMEHKYLRDFTDGLCQQEPINDIH